MIILACATKRECQSALARLAPQLDTWPVDIHFGGQDILVCITGVGPVAAALSIGALLERYPHASGVLNLGICGSFSVDDYPLGCPCVADAEIWPEYGIHCAGTGPEEIFTHQMLPNLALFPANHLDLTPSLAAKTMGLCLPDNWPTGHSITVAGVTGDIERAQALQYRYNAATENMEGFSLALAARQRGIAFLEIRTVSNQVGQRNKKRWRVKSALGSLETLLPTLLEGQR